MRVGREREREERERERGRAVQGNKGAVAQPSSIRALSQGSGTLGVCGRIKVPARVPHTV